MHIPETAFAAVAVTVAFGLASPVMAQHRRGGGDGDGGSNRGSESQGTAVPRAAQPPASAPAPAPAPRDNGQRPDNGARAERPPRFNNNNNYDSHGSSARDQRDVARRSSPSVRGDGYRNDVHRNDAYRNDGYRNGRYRNGNSNYGNSNYAYRGYDRRGYRYAAPVRFYRPYYSFRPWFSLGFGLWGGYPVPYAYSYYDPYYYGSAYSYPSTVYPSTVYPSGSYPAYPPATSYPQSAYPPSAYPQSGYPQTVPAPNSIGVQPGQANTGGLSFDITPGDADVLVDGNLVGTAGEFSPTSQPLGLSAGRHQVQIVASGYQTISFDVNIVAGQVLPYQGSLARR